MRKLNEAEMSAVAGGVDPVPTPGQETDVPMPEIDTHWLICVLPDLYPPTIPFRAL